MATIQIRNVPEDVHRTHRERAAAAGMSLQEYLLGELTRGARMRSPAELIEEIERGIRAVGADGLTSVSSADHVGADRNSH
ncbi:MAG: antitoxin [Actinomycetota bacterium]|nr:antitoxin [Actinomycetota bacterium]